MGRSLQERALQDDDLIRRPRPLLLNFTAPALHDILPCPSKTVPVASARSPRSQDARKISSDPDALPGQGALQHPSSPASCDALSEAPPSQRSLCCASFIAQGTTAMIPSPRTPRQSTAARPSRARQRVSPAITTRQSADSSIVAATEPPLKRRRFTPSGPEPPVFSQDKETSTTPATVGVAISRSRTRQPIMSGITNSPSLYPRRERSTRIRTSTRHADQNDEMQISSAAAVAAAVVQSEGYKPREERGWEEFHPNLDIDSSFMIYHADDVDGTAKSAPATPSFSQTTSEINTAGNFTVSPSKDPAAAILVSSTAMPVIDNTSTPAGQGVIPGTPTRSRRAIRPPRDSFYPLRPELANGPKVPTVLPIHNQTPKERLDLKLPSYRKTDRILLFESKKSGQARYVEKAMMNVGYQESDEYIRPDRRLITASDANLEDEPESTAALRIEGEAATQHPGSVLGRVEYDMDEQDDMWLEAYNLHRKSQGWNPVTREVFEITITKIEKEWHALEKRIPKPNPKPPQTHRPRSSSAAAVNGEPQTGEEQDSKCAICDDGDCENTNAIVFCDGCDLAVHQECYGVPFIPEGQWLCRKCQLIGRGVPVSFYFNAKPQHSVSWSRLLTFYTRHAYSVPTRMGPSSKPTRPNGRIYYVLCGYPR